MDAPISTPAAPAAPAAAVPGTITTSPGQPEVNNITPVINTPAPAVEVTPAPAAVTIPPVTTEPTAPVTLTIEAPPVYKHEPTGNAAYDVAMTAFAEKGFNPDHPAFQAAVDGDFAGLEAWAKETGVGQQYVDLAKQAHSQISEHQKAVHGETIAKAMEIAGGAEVWNQVAAWVAKEASPEERASWAEQLEAGGTKTLSAVKYLTDLYQNYHAGQPNTNPADPVKANASAVTPSGAAPLNPQEFRAELGKLIEKIGYSSLESSTEYKALQQRRLAWRG